MGEGRGGADEVAGCVTDSSPNDDDDDFTRRESRLDSTEVDLARCKW